MSAEVQLRGEGGVVWTFSLPLSETYADQVRKGRLQAADPESAELLAASGIWASPETASEGGEPEDVAMPPKSGKGSGKDAWAAYAASRGIGTEGMTKAKIIAAVGG